MTNRRFHGGIQCTIFSVLDFSGIKMAIKIIKNGSKVPLFMQDALTWSIIKFKYTTVLV